MPIIRNAKKNPIPTTTPADVSKGCTENLSRLTITGADRQYGGCRVCHCVLEIFNGDNWVLRGCSWTLISTSNIWAHVPSGRYGIVSAKRHDNRVVGAELESNTFLR